MSEMNWVEVTNVPKRSTWRGEEEGDCVIGRFVEYKDVTKKDQSVSPVLTLIEEDTDVEVTVWLKSQLLRLVKEANLQPDQLIKIEYLGRQKLKSDKTKSFRAYKLYVAASV